MKDFHTDLADFAGAINRTNALVHTPESDDRDPESALARALLDLHKKLSRLVRHFEKTEDIVVSRLTPGREFIDPVQNDRHILLTHYPNFEAVVLDSGTRKRGSHWQCLPNATVKALIF